MSGRKLFALLVSAFVLAVAFAVPAGAAEFRGFWVDSWGSGFENATATTTMLDYVQSCKCNAVFVEMRKRGDAYYTSSYEPTGTGIAPAAGYDCLADIVTKAHARSIEVHAWVVTYRAWTSQTAPATTTPNHVFNAHPEWFALTDTGAKFGSDNSSYLDPGHPEVENHLRNVFMEIITNYDIDGFCLDYIRYAGTNWGYNATSVSRYNTEYGLSGNPSSSDPQWLNWRRDQVTNLVKRMYIEAKAVRPDIKMGASVWSTAAVGNNSYLQNWDSWMSNHWLDYASPMNYQTDNTAFDNENHDSATRQYGHHVYISQGSYLNTISNSMTQIGLVQADSILGVNPYSYRVTNSGTVDKTGFKNALIAGPFASTQSIPAMSWISSPTTGMLKGFVRNSSGVAIYPSTVTISTQSTKNSGTGFYGFVDLAPGTYTVTASAPGYTNGNGQVTITAGQVATLNLTLGVDTVPPVISSVQSPDVRATVARITWTTDEIATSQVDYGLTTSYGSTTTLDAALVTSHTVMLAGLTPNATYHYRVRSKDGANNERVSGDYAFTTAATEVVDDLIVDNPACELVGAWTTGTSATDKYGTNYIYAGTATSETKTAKWRPNVLVTGTYDVYCWYSAGANRSAVAPYTVYWNGGSQQINVNQQSSGGVWNLLVSDKRCDIGTAQYVKLGNGTSEASLIVVADAVKLVFKQYVDAQAPTAPTNLSAVSSSTSQIDLTWTASTDNMGVTGYEIYRNGVYVTSVTGTSWSDTGRTMGTNYSYYVKAYDAAGNKSANSNTDSATTWIILDNGVATYVGTWSTGNTATDKYGADYKYCTTATSETKSAKWTPTINSAGAYDVYCWYPAGSNRSIKAPYTVYYNGGNVTVQVNQTLNGGMWNFITSRSFAAGTAGYIKLGNGTAESSKNVMADAIRLTKVE